MGLLISEGVSFYLKWRPEGTWLLTNARLVFLIPKGFLL